MDDLPPGAVPPTQTQQQLSPQMAEAAQAGERVARGLAQDLDLKPGQEVKINSVSDLQAHAEKWLENWLWDKLCSCCKSKPDQDQDQDQDSD